MANTLKCPKCGEEIELSQAFTSEIKAKVEEKAKLEIDDLKKALQEKDEKVEELRDKELKFRLEMERKIDFERKKVEEEVLKHAVEEHRLKDMEKDKKISDLMNSLEDAKRKAQQGSQQLQGEVLELDLEETLKNTFPNDEIEPVGKGVKGADVRQIVKSPKGFNCGVILWESKRTKDWKNEWLTKLKNDLRAEKANIPVIVTSVLPKGVKSMEQVEGVWITTYELALPMASLLRKSLLDVAYEKAINLHKGEKADVLYEYITGHEFRQQVEALVEVYKEMNDEISKEKAAFERIWKAREGQVSRILISAAGMVGSIQGKVGQSALQVKGLDLLDAE
ncbi:MAG: DUF2130 domain-containing protein [Patescibacteria group bacterium]